MSTETSIFSFRKRLVESGNEVGQPRLGNGFRHTQPEQAADAVRRHDIGLDAFDKRRDLFRVIAQEHALLGQRDPSRATGEQGCAQVAFQAGDARRYGWLRDVHLLCGFAHAAQPRNP